MAFGADVAKKNFNDHIGEWNGKVGLKCLILPLMIDSL